MRLRLMAMVESGRDRDRFIGGAQYPDLLDSSEKVTDAQAK